MQRNQSSILFQYLQQIPSIHPYNTCRNPIPSFRTSLLAVGGAAPSVLAACQLSARSAAAASSSRRAAFRTRDHHPPTCNPDRAQTTDSSRTGGQFTGHTFLGGQHINPKAYGPSGSTRCDTGNKGRAERVAAHSAPNPHGPGAIERMEMSHPPPRRVANPPSRRDGEHVVSPPRSARREGVPPPPPPLGGWEGGMVGGRGEVREREEG